MYNEIIESAIEAGNFEYAESILTKAIRRRKKLPKPHMYAALFNRAAVYYKAGEYRKSLADFEKAEKIKKTDADLYYNRGILYDEIGFFEQAVRDFDTAEMLESANAPPKNRVADKLFYRVRIESIFSKRGNTYRRMGRYEEAFEDLNKAVKLDTVSTEAYIYRSLLYDELGDFENAIDDLVKSIKIKKENGDAYYYLARIYDNVLNFASQSEKYLRRAAHFGHPKARAIVMLNGILRN